jgi:signal transduction histidine kinase
MTGITAVLPHLLYIPVVAAAYRYPKWGLLTAGIIGGVYILIVIIFQGSTPLTVIEALARTIVIVLIGGLIAFLTRRLGEREALYKGLFDHSESGSILIMTTGPKRVIEEMNWKAAHIVHRNPSDLRGAPITAFWDVEAENEFFRQLSIKGTVYSEETIFTVSDGRSADVLISAAALPEGRAILTVVDITGRVQAEKALVAAKEKLNLLSRISVDHLHRTIDRIIEAVDEEDETCSEPKMKGFCERIRALAWNVTRQLFLTESYKDLGTVPPLWMGVQQILESIPLPRSPVPVSVRIWTGRLEIYADPLFRDVLLHIVENALRHGHKVKNLVVTYHKAGNGLDLVFEDDGVGIPAEKKQTIFEYDSGGHAGIGLFICRQITAVTGMTLTENGTEGKGARFVIHIPPEGYRIEGTGDDVPAHPVITGSAEAGLRGVPHATGTVVREFSSAEFPVAEALWIDYHQTKGDPKTDRIFAAFLNGRAVSVGRCKCHPDGSEVDGIFTPVEFRGHGYANAVVWGLIEACGRDTLYMHSVKNLTGFYSHFGFVPIDESELPSTIRERFAWAVGEMEGANVCPMKRPPDP